MTKEQKAIIQLCQIVGYLWGTLDGLYFVDNPRDVARDAVEYAEGLYAEIEYLHPPEGYND
jgi:hypothetical protein